MRLLYFATILTICTDLLNGQLNEQYNELIDYKNIPRKYSTNESGTLLMNINIWSQTSSGSFTVPENVNFVDILTLAGGAQKGYNYKKIEILREVPNAENQYKILVNLENFLKTGDRSQFINIMPNDTIVIKQKLFYFFLSSVSDFTTIISIFSLALSLIN